MPKFRVLRGFHVQDGREYGVGQVVESRSDLCLLDPPRAESASRKFERVSDVAVDLAPSTEEDLAKKTVDELRKIAADLGIDVGKARTRQQMINIIYAATTPTPDPDEE